MKQKSIWCPNCGHLLDEGWISAYRKILDWGPITLCDEKELDVDWRGGDQITGTDDEYVCGSCDATLDLEYDDIVNIFQSINKAAQEYEKDTGLISSENEEHFNQWLKLHNYE